MERRGERIGWTFGWIGGYVWVLALSAVFLYQQRWPEAALGLAVTAFGALAALAGAPWHHPHTRLWKLMMVPYLGVFASVGWAVWAYGGPGALGLSPWHALWLLWLFMPLLGNGSRRWVDGAPPEAGG